MTIKEALKEVHNLLMNVETKGESSLHLVAAVELLSQIEAIIEKHNDEETAEATNDEEEE